MTDPDAAGGQGPAGGAPERRNGTGTAPEAADAVDTAGYRHLARAVLYREYLVFVRYPANAVGGIVLALFFFGLLFYGGRMVAGRALTDSLEGIIVGYFLWTLSVGAYSGLANDIRSEVQWGTLERHITTPFGFAPVALLKGAAKVVRTFLTSGLILAVMLVVTDTSLNVDFVTVVTVSTLTVVSVLGVGFAAGGISVLYKRIGNWLNLLQFGFILLISAPAVGAGWARVLPLAHGSALLQRAMVDGTRLWEFPAGDLLLLGGTAAGYLGLGYLVFTLATRRARRLGVLGDY